jgi:hypothetical protein
MYAWGSAHALNGAVTLVDVLCEQQGDPEAQALVFEARLGAEIGDRHDTSVIRDRALRRAYHGEPMWDDPDHGHGFIESTVVPAANEDPDIFRAVMRRELQLDPMSALAENTAVLDRARSLAAVRERKPKDSSAPTREDLLELMTGAERNPRPPYRSSSTLDPRQP